jgi:hypothetical protein
MKIKNFIYLILSLLFFLYLFVVYDVNFRGPDEPIYFAYTASVVEDGDLNVVNNISRDSNDYFPSGQLLVSKNYNLPDFHNHGGVVLWAPFYAYAKVTYLLAKELNLKLITDYGFDKFFKCTMSFSTVIFGFLTLLFTYLLCRMFFSIKISLGSTFTLFFGTPFFYYTLFEPGNADIIASLFFILSLWFLSYAINMKNWHWFLYGIFFSICVTVKTSLWLQVFFILAFFITLAMLKKVNWKKGLYFLIGLALGLTLKVINDYIKYGVFHEGYVGLLNIRAPYLYEQLFSSYRGFLYTSPIFYVCLAGFVILTLNLSRNIKSINESKIRDFLFFYLTLYVFIKIFLISFRYAWGGGTCGARPLLTEFPIFVLLFARALEGQKKYTTYFLCICSVFFILWNWLIISEFIARLDLKYVALHPKITTRIISLEYMRTLLFTIKDLNLKLSSCALLFTPAVFFCLKEKNRYLHHSFLRHINNIKQDRLFKSLIAFAVYSYVAYAIFTAMNIYNNGRQVETLKESGFFKDAKVIKLRDFERTENIGSMDEMIEYFNLKGNIDKVKNIKEHKKEMFGDDSNG